MTDLSLYYYDGAEWQDLTSKMQNFKIEESGVTRVTNGTITLFGKASDLSSYLANPYRLMKLRIKPEDTWQDIFYGYVDNPFHKALLGMTTDMRVVSLDVFGWEQRLATDFITFDYYKLQSALTPLTDANAWTYRKMIEDFIAYPDSTRDGTGLSGITMDLIAATDAAGIDHIINSSCAWSRQSLFDAVRTVCDNIGYDGYYSMNGDTLTPEFHLYPFSKASSGYIYAPYIKEPEYEGGSLNDVANVIFVWGGIDAGVPNDGDRWTEYAATKYNPAIWSATRTGASSTVTDADNTVFSAENRANAKCVKFSTTGSVNNTLLTSLNLANTEIGTIDALNRITNVYFTLKLFQSASNGYKRYVDISLQDGSSNVISYRMRCSQDSVQFGDDAEINVGLSLGSDIEIATTPAFERWYYLYGSTFDWEHIAYLNVKSIWNAASVPSGWTFGHYIDGLTFQGGMKIEPFQAYSATLNPPLKNQTSINQYGIHPIHYQNAQLSSFEQAQADATRVLNNLKNPIPRLTLTKLAPATQFHPSNVVTISGVDYRIASMTYEWSTNTKEVAVTYKTIGKTNPLPPIWTEQNELRYLIK